MANLFIAGIEDQLGDFGQRSILPDAPFFVELLGDATDPTAADVQATELRADLGDLARGDALHVHVRHGEFQRPLAAFAVLQRGRVELDVASRGTRDYSLPAGCGRSWA